MGVMSRAGTKSHQGDEYQRLIALHWIIRLLNRNEAISFIQVESNGLPGIEEEFSVDDIVVVYDDGHRLHIQAKKNQPANRAWSLSDQSLIEELPKIRDQLEGDGRTIVKLYSRTPFGDLQSLVESSHEYPDLSAFMRQSGGVLQRTLTTLADKWKRSESETFEFLKRLKFGSALSIEEWRRQNLCDLSRLIASADRALPILDSLINSHQSKFQGTQLIIRADDVFRKLELFGLVPAPMLSEQDILAQFQQASRIGREWQRTIGGRSIERAELGGLIQLLKEGANTVIVTDRPGSGKTCLLLDVADRIEQDHRFGLLFIKGDLFTHLRSEKELRDAGFPDEIIGLCGRLSEYRHVVVIIDSMDVLSMNRDQGALRVFLRLVDRLQPMQNVTAVVACRSFDLQYDPLLRGRKWNHKIQLADFDYETVVSPLLKEWGVKESGLDAVLKRLLTLPQNLRLFEAIAKRSGRSDIRTDSELQQAYLEEVVLKDPKLSTPAMDALKGLAEILLRERIRAIPSSGFPGNEPIRRGLVSSGVLSEDKERRIGFSHQTLLDTLVVHSSWAKGEDLAGFIKSHPPLPFLRPAVRNFVFQIRTQTPESFNKQIWAVLTDAAIAYHFKRLITESLAEVIPQEDDWSLLRRLFREQPELFRRLFWRLESETWFRFLVDKWLPALGPAANDSEWYALFAAQLDRWMNSHPSEVVAFWRRALSEGWGGEGQLAWNISVALQKFQHWTVVGIKELIETLLKEKKADFDLLGQVVSRYVEATDQGDELLWSYITRDEASERVQDFRFESKLHCEPHDFHDEHFLKKRLSRSERLLDFAIEHLLALSAKIEDLPTGRRLRSAFLHSSSWERYHSRNDMYHVDAAKILFDGVEHALKQHAKLNSAWWRRWESQLRDIQEEAFLYLLALAYKENPEANIDGIATLITDAELLRYNHIQHELGQLIGASYHLLPSEAQEKNQRIILCLFNEEEWVAGGKPEWMPRNAYEYLSWIPRIFRFPFTQAFIERFQPSIGPGLPEPEIYSSGGTVDAPVPLENLLKLSNPGLLRLLKYYNDYSAHSSHPADHCKGGRGMVERVLLEAAAYDPQRYLALVPTIYCCGLQSGYLVSLLEGVADHLMYRYGRLQPPQGWGAKEPKPEGDALARSLLDIIDGFPDIYKALWTDGRGLTRILEACCELIEDNSSAERLVFHFYRLLRHQSPEEEKQRERVFDQYKERVPSKDLRSAAIYSVRGIAAGAAIRLCNRFLEFEREPPELLFSVVRHFARDPHHAVRAALLDHLPYLTYKRHAWGWGLFHDIFREPQTHLWPLAERHLYHQYQGHFAEVGPCLERILSEAPQAAAGTWSRIATLSSLSGHIEQNMLFAQLKLLNSVEAWKGAAQVFVANIDRHGEKCLNGIKRILLRESMDSQVLNCIENAFDPKTNGKLLDLEAAILLVKGLGPDSRGFDTRHLYEWIGDTATRDPVAALGICEHLSDRLIELKATHKIWHSEPLISALSSILREADETGDEALIKRAVRLQDTFLSIDLRGIEGFFEQSARL
jgi:hypothetical protein